jgi:hypothetical protein
VTKIIYLILLNLVTPKARAKHEPYVQQTGLRIFHPLNSLVVGRNLWPILL